uniref:J domain-containing protein n=1 Tax=Oryza rufipogon TaxID=4529 RepID=A0A0E0QQI4_ORYRU
MNTAVEVRCAAGGGGGVNAAAFGRRMMRPAPAGHCRVIRAAATSTVASGRGEDDYYKVLSLDRAGEVGAEEIRRAYRRLALRYHPDACPPSRCAESTRLFLQLRRAYETLSDPALRVRYDAELMMRVRRPARPAAEEDASSSSSSLARDVWEAQLRTLRARSDERRRHGAAGTARRGRWFEVGSSAPYSKENGQSRDKPNSIKNL